MAAIRQTVAETIEDVISWRPVLEPVLRAFEPLMTAQAEIVAELSDSVHAADLALPDLAIDRARQGVSVLAGKKIKGTAKPLRISAQKLLPLMENMGALNAHMQALKAFFLQPIEKEASGSLDSLTEILTESHEALLEAVASGNREAIARIAESNGIEARVFDFVSGIIVSPVLRAMVTRSLSGAGSAPWNEGERWQHGYCPVCGALPSVSWLDKPSLDEKNAFLAGGGGKKHLHCGLCGANWKFRRGTCPLCEEEGNGVIEILRESGIAHGERLEWCTKCKS